MNLSRITDPTVLPVSIEEVDKHLELDLAMYDAGQLARVTDKINRLIAAARDYIEEHCGITMHESTFRLVLDGWPCHGPIYLPRSSPLIALTSITYRDSSEITATWSSSEYVLDTNSRPARILPKSGYNYPSFTLSPLAPITITYRAGIANASPQSEVAATVKHAVLLLVGAMWETPEAEVITDRASVEAAALKYSLDSFLRLLKVEYAF